MRIVIPNLQSITDVKWFNMKYFPAFLTWFLFIEKILAIKMFPCLFRGHWTLSLNCPVFNSLLSSRCIIHIRSQTCAKLNPLPFLHPPQICFSSNIFRPPYSSDNKIPEEHPDSSISSFPPLSRIWYYTHYILGRLKSLLFLLYDGSSST